MAPRPRSVPLPLPVLLLSLSVPALPQDGPEEVIEAVERGAYREARELLAELLVARNLAEAETALEGGRPDEAMILLDEALELRPKDADLLARRGRAAYATAEIAASEGGLGNPQFFYEDAFDHLLRAGSAHARAGNAERVVRVAFDASRAARRIPDPERALELARKGMEKLEALESPPSLDPPPERVLAEATFDVYIQRRRAGEDAGELYLETEDLLSRLLGEEPTTSWPLQQLSNLYQWNGEPERAIGAIEQALNLSPAEQALHDRLARLVPPHRGWPALVGWYDEFVQRHPESATVHRNAGVARFYAALAAFEEGATDPAPFRAAEAEFRRARELDEALREDCLGYEAICRDAVGWCHYNAGDYSAAKEAFLSMEDLFEGGLAWSLGDRLPSGIDGLGFVIGKLSENPLSEQPLDDMVEAAAIADYLFAYRPQDGDHANNAGFFNRDAAVLFERRSREVRAQARARDDAEERRELEAEARRLMDRAHELMDRSEAAYKVAARLSPEDVRIINDAALVMVYYTRDDPETAERLLLRAVELGGPQLEDPTLSDEARYALNEAWGDAHQNMAILELTLRRDGKAAREWLEQALEIGPASREEVRPLLEVCDAVAADPDHDLSSSPLLRNMVWLHSPRR